MNTQANAANTVVFDQPITRGNQVIDQVSIRRPVSGDLRGVSLSALANFDVLAMRKVLPRITMPMLTEADIDSMDPADLMQFAQVFADFLLPKAVKASMESQSA